MVSALFTDVHGKCTPMLVALHYCPDLFAARLHDVGVEKQLFRRIPAPTYLSVGGTAWLSAAFFEAQQTCLERTSM